MDNFSRMTTQELLSNRYQVNSRRPCKRPRHEEVTSSGQMSESSKRIRLQSPDDRQGCRPRHLVGNDSMDITVPDRVVTKRHYSQYCAAERQLIVRDARLRGIVDASEMYNVPKFTLYSWMRNPQNTSQSGATNKPCDKMSDWLRRRQAAQATMDYITQYHKHSTGTHGYAVHFMSHSELAQRL